MTIKELLHLSASKLKRVVALKSQIERLEAELGKLVSATSSAPAEKAVHPRRKMSAATKAKIYAAAKARWAKVHTAKSKSPAAAKVAKKGKRTMSAAARRKIAAAAKARWAKAKAAGKKRL